MNSPQAPGNEQQIQRADLPAEQELPSLDSLRLRGTFSQSAAPKAIQPSHLTEAEYAARARAYLDKVSAFRNPKDGSEPSFDPSLYDEGKQLVSSPHYSKLPQNHQFAVAVSVVGSGAATAEASAELALRSARTAEDCTKIGISPRAMKSAYEAYKHATEQLDVLDIMIRKAPPGVGREAQLTQHEDIWKELRASISSTVRKVNAASMEEILCTWKRQTGETEGSLARPNLNMTPQELDALTEKLSASSEGVKLDLERSNAVAARVKDILGLLKPRSKL